MPDEVIPLNETVQSLYRNGLSPETIAASLGLDKAKVSAIVKQHRLHPEDEEILEASRRLAMRAIHQAEDILEMGPTDARNRLINTFVSGMVKLIGSERAGSAEEMRLEFEQLLTDQRDVGAETRSPPEKTDDSGQTNQGTYPS